MLDGVRMTVAESHMLLSQVEMAMVSHEDWLSELFKGLVCGDTLGERFVGEKAFKRCQFGRWLYSHGNDALMGAVVFQDIEFLHRRMHSGVNELVQNYRSRSETSPTLSSLYDEVITMRMAFRRIVKTLEHQVCYTILNTDPLTNTLGRGKLIPTVEREMGWLRKYRNRSSIIAMVDVDHFKKVNDTYGHLVGDRVLVEVARYIKASLRPSDLIFRFGGEEFLVLFPNTPLEVAGPLLDRLREALSQFQIASGNGGSFVVTASFGATKLCPSRSPHENIEVADNALYQAKEGGRNRVVLL
jgi:diguanylate cyclase (GGDEF)-like protein